VSRIKTLSHKGCSILFVDYSNIGPADLDDIINEVRPLIDVAAPKSVLMLSDFTNVTYDKEATAKMKEFAQLNTPFIRASAILGITGLKKVIYTGVVRATGRNIHLCKTLDEAKDWLASQ